MNTILALLVLTVFIAMVAALVWDLFRTIDRDGLGHRPPPPSHYSDLDLFPRH
ncbi:MAG: hypothetical protein M3211_13350 [Actinomycetota bacterium]|nr:hypothetical protein [Actinomycetota bacterium]